MRQTIHTLRRDLEDAAGHVILLEAENKNLAKRVRFLELVETRAAELNLDLELKKRALTAATTALIQIVGILEQDRFPASAETTGDNPP